LTAGIREARLVSVPAIPTLPPVARFEFFQTTGRQAGVWVVRQGDLSFALPITTATRPGLADYLPAPHGLPGFAAPVEQVLPALVPFIELADGRTIVAADGADQIAPRADGWQLSVTWTRWAQVGAKPTELVDPGIASHVTFTLDDRSLTRIERLTSTRAVRVKTWRMILPATGERWDVTYDANQRQDALIGRDGRLTVSVGRSDWPLTISGRATGDRPAGRGARGAIPLHLVFEAHDIELQPGTPRGWELRLSVE
jgi:hypothetical protein